MNTSALPARVDTLFTDLDWLDPVAEDAQEAVAKLFDSLGPLREEVEDTLHGKFLGHPLHPILVEFPIGAWSTAAVMDALEMLGVKGIEKGTDFVVAVGLVGSLGAAASGLTDWHDLRRLPRRIGLVHGLMNVGAQVLYLLSLRARQKGKRRLGRVLSLAGLATVSASGYLGGHMIFHHRVGMGGPID